MAGEDSGHPVRWEQVSGGCLDLRVEGQKIAIERNSMPSMRMVGCCRSFSELCPVGLFTDMTADELQD